MNIAFFRYIGHFQTFTRIHNFLFPFIFLKKYKYCIKNYIYISLFKNIVLIQKTAAIFIIFTLNEVTMNFLCLYQNKMSNLIYSQLIGLL